VQVSLGASIITWEFRTWTDC